jgi:chemotaxis regulatin CheY-phosphate phosphatase CheZ
MQQFINTLFNPDVLDKLGLAGLTLVAIVVAVWLLLRYTGRQVAMLAEAQERQVAMLAEAQERQVATLTEAQRQQALAHAEAMQTVKQSLDNNTQTLRMLNDSMSDLRENMSDLRETVHELYGFIRSVVKRDGGDEKET